ncbi:MAG: BTAD domain-containing putative transcriptional regulator [Streptosporangiaceae bacterium]
MNDVNNDNSFKLMLLGGFTLLRDAEEIEFPMSAQRLVALLALHERPLSRTYLAGVLWPNCPSERSLADLRTALWRANHCNSEVIATAGVRLSLRAGIEVDVRVLAAFGRTPHQMESNAIAQLEGMSWFDLSLDLLPDWSDDWLVDDREGVRQLRLHALERMTGELSLSRRHGEAIQAALAAVRLEPLRETAHAALIRAYLAEGNRSEALRQFSRCRAILGAELGVEPSESICELIASPAVLSDIKSSRSGEGRQQLHLAGRAGTSSRATSGT